MCSSDLGGGDIVKKQKSRACTNTQVNTQSGVSFKASCMGTKHVKLMLRGIYKVHFSSRLSERGGNFGRIYFCQNCQFSNRYSSVDFGPMLLKWEHKMWDHGTIKTFSIDVFDQIELKSVKIIIPISSSLHPRSRTLFWSYFRRKNESLMRRHRCR